MISKYGSKKATLYARAHEQAIDEYGKMIRLYGINCHFEQLPAYLYSTYKTEILKNEAQAATSLGLPAHFLNKLDLPIDNVGAVCFERQAQFHPLEFIKEVAKDLEIYEKTKVLKVKGNRVYTEKAEVLADYIVFATHYPFINVPGFYFARQHQERSYIVAFEDAQKLNGMYYSIDEDGLSLRNYENILLAGGGSHRTGEHNGKSRYDNIRSSVKECFPDAKEITRWSAQDAMPHDGLPFIGSYSMQKPYWYVATGFQKWGMTSAMLAAMIIRDEICDIESPYAKLFSPQRLHPFASAGGFITDIGKSVEGLCKGTFRRKISDGKRLKCPHMGCELNWNEDEQSWDCPCHGSRFDKDGNLIDNPAQKNIMN